MQLKKEATVQAGAAIGTIRRVTSEKLSMQVVRSLAMYIIGAGSAEAFALPREPELCQKLEVSRTVLREAVKVLEAKGLVAVGHGQGMTARARREWNHLDPDILLWRSESEVDEQFVRDICELRQIIEPAAAQLAATNASDEEIAAIGRWYRQMETDVDNPEAYIRADLEFHNAIMLACGNHLLAQMTQSIAAALRVTRDVSIRVPEGWADSLHLHRVLYEAISERDPIGAHSASMVIIRSVAHDVSAVLSSRSAQAAQPSQPAVH